MNTYKTNIDSIGTEISDTKYEQDGGNFLARLFGISNNTLTDNNLSLISSENVNDTEKMTDTEVVPKMNIDLTQLIIKAIDDKNYPAADYLIAQRFTPDLNYVNRKKQNLINALVNAREHMKLADKALLQLIPYDSNALNAADNNGVTPFFNAVKNGYNELANYMENFGAKRVAPSNDYDIVTDNEYNNTTESVVINLDTATDMQSVNPSIFAKQSPNDNMNKNNEIADIVNAFRTKSDNSTDLVGTAAIGATEYQPDTYNIFDANTNSNKDIKASLESLKNLINKRSSSTLQPNNIFQNPLNNTNNITNTEEFVDNLAGRLIGNQDGGARKAKNDMRNIARAVKNQKDEFHKNAVDKIYELLPKDKKDMLTAKAVKSLIYAEIKEKHSELSGLDRVSELLKAINKDKVKEMLKRDKEIDEITNNLEMKQQNSVSDSASTK